jgi:hypothetical protein
MGEEAEPGDRVVRLLEFEEKRRTGRQPESTRSGRLPEIDFIKI